MVVIMRASVRRAQARIRTSRAEENPNQNGCDRGRRWWSTGVSRAASSCSSSGVRPKNSVCRVAVVGFGSRRHASDRRGRFGEHHPYGRVRSTGRKTGPSVSRRTRGSGASKALSESMGGADPLHLRASATGCARFTCGARPRLRDAGDREAQSGMLTNHSSRRTSILVRDTAARCGQSTEEPRDRSIGSTGRTSGFRQKTTRSPWRTSAWA